MGKMRILVSKSEFCQSVHGLWKETGHDGVIELSTKVKRVIGEIDFRVHNSTENVFNNTTDSDYGGSILWFRHIFNVERLSTFFISILYIRANADPSRATFMTRIFLLRTETVMSEL